MRWIKKRLNILSKEQKLVISNQQKLISNITKKEDKIRRDKEEAEREKHETRQNTCSKCQSTKNEEKVVEEEETRTRYNQSISFIGSVPMVQRKPEKYSYTTRKYVTCCSECENEWEKVSWYSRWSFRRSKSYRQEVTKYIEDRYDYPSLFEVHVNRKYEDFYAESFHEFFGDISLRTCRKIFKSIFDEEKRDRRERR